MFSNKRSQTLPSSGEPPAKKGSSVANDDDEGKKDVAKTEVSENTESKPTPTTTPTNNKNNLEILETFSSTFYIMRHGNSKANLAKIISSNPTLATKQHGLTPLGVEQVASSASNFTASKACEVAKSNGAVVVSSDFTRARETAEILVTELIENDVKVVNDGVILDVSLRERFFGDLDAGSDSSYVKCWKFDAEDADHTEFNVESVNSVINRTTSLVSSLDEKYNGMVIFLVAHGDVLQILQTAVERVDPRTHRSLKHLDTATIREIVLKEKVEGKE